MNESQNELQVVKSIRALRARLNSGTVHLDEAAEISKTHRDEINAIRTRNDNSEGISRKLIPIEEKWA